MSKIRSELVGLRSNTTLRDAGNRAQELGWQDCETMGRSGHVEREGFEALLAEVCQGQVGGAEASRLARNGHEWHRLLEFCGGIRSSSTMSIYNPKHPNDRLVLSLRVQCEMEVAMSTLAGGYPPRLHACARRLRATWKRILTNVFELLFEKFRAG